jgi:hypothetical protein
LIVIDPYYVLSSPPCPFSNLTAQFSPFFTQFSLITHHFWPLFINSWPFRPILLLFSSPASYLYPSITVLTIRRLFLSSTAHFRLFSLIFTHFLLNHRLRKLRYRMKYNNGSRKWERAEEGVGARVWDAERKGTTTGGSRRRFKHQVHFFWYVYCNIYSTNNYLGTRIEYTYRRER